MASGKGGVMAEALESEARRDFLESLEQGEVRTGVVSSIERFGALVDIGGVDGLVGVPELSWRRFSAVSDVVEVGQEVTVTVLGVDMRRSQVALSLKALWQDPLVDFARTHLGRVVQGPVTKVVPFGVFVRVHEDVEGLVPLAEFTGRDGGLVPQDGAELVVEVVDINLLKRRVKLALRG